MPFRFESLDIGHMARAYANHVYPLCARLPRSEDYGLKSQINRAVYSIVLNIAEGSARSTNKAFDAYLEIAVGSTFEVVAAACLALDRSYINEEEHQSLYNEGQRLARAINAFRGSLH